MFLRTVCWDLTSQAENLKTLTGSNNQKKRKKKKMNLQNCKSSDINKLETLHFPQCFKMPETVTQWTKYLQIIDKLFQCEERLISWVKVKQRNGQIQKEAHRSSSSEAAAVLNGCQWKREKKPSKPTTTPTQPYRANMQTLLILAVRRRRLFTEWTDTYTEAGDAPSSQGSGTFRSISWSCHSLISHWLRGRESSTCYLIGRCPSNAIIPLCFLSRSGAISVPHTHTHINVNNS